MGDYGGPPSGGGGGGRDRSRSRSPARGGGGGGGGGNAKLFVRGLSFDVSTTCCRSPARAPARRHADGRLLAAAQRLAASFIHCLRPGAPRAAAPDAAHGTPRPTIALTTTTPPRASAVDRPGHERPLRQVRQDRRGHRREGSRDRLEPRLRLCHVRRDAAAAAAAAAVTVTAAAAASPEDGAARAPAAHPPPPSPPSPRSRARHIPRPPPLTSYEDARDAEDAVRQLDSTDFMGRQIFVQLSRPKPEMGGGGGGGGE